MNMGMELFLSLGAQGILLFWFVYRAVRVTIRSQSILRGAATMYGLFVLWAVLFCVLIPAVLIKWTGNTEIWKFFPEMTGLAGILLIGWLHSLIVAGLARTVQRVVGKFRSRFVKSGKPSGENNL